MSGRAGKTAEKGSVEQQDVRVNEHGQARSSGSHDSILALQRMAGNRAVTDLLKRSSGRPLDADTRVEMEAKFGEDFRDVRVHAGGAAAASASLLNANAFTAGQDIAFGEGRYSPRTSGGKTLLAHELAHVVQQRRGGPTPRTFEPQSAAEQDAAAASGEFAGAGPVSVSSATGTGVAREEAKELPWWKKRLNPLYRRALEVLPKGAAEELKQANAAAKKFVEKTGTTDESLNKAVQAAEPVLKPITDYLAAKPEAPPAAKTDAEKTETWQGGPTMPLGEGLFWRQDPDPTEFETKLRAGKPFPVKIPRKPDIDPRSVNWIGGRPTDEQMGKMAFRDVNNPSRQIFVDEGTQVDLTVDSSSVMPIRDPKTHELKGYRYRHEDGMWTLDRDGKVLGARNLEKPLEHPEIDPIDVAMLGADLGPLAAKGIQAGGKALLRKIAKSGARELGEVGSEEAGTLIGREASEGLTSSASHQKEVPQIELGGNPPGDVHPLESPSVRPAEHALPDEARLGLHDLGPHEPAADVLAPASRGSQKLAPSVADAAADEGPTIARFGEDEVKELTGMWERRLAAEKDPNRAREITGYIRALKNRSRPGGKLFGKGYQAEEEAAHIYSLIGGKGETAFEVEGAGGVKQITKPDFDAPNVRGEVKNWEMIHIQSESTAKSMLDNLAAQVKARKGIVPFKDQTVILDLRGQKLTEEQLQKIGKTFSEKTGLPPRNIQIVTWAK
jgi:Domain of unknown function (DUF4157)